MSETISNDCRNCMPGHQHGPSASSGTQRERWRLLLVGDCMLGRLVNETLESASPEYPWGDTLPLLHNADWRLCNLECVISDRGTPWSGYPKAFHFRSAAKNIAVLKGARMNAVSLANNHVLDYGYDAMFEMLGILDHAGIIHSGAGIDLSEASRLAIAQACGRRIGLLAFTDNEPDWEAGANRPGVFYVPTDLTDIRAKRVLGAIREYTKMTDYLIVSAHWGFNWGYVPPKEHVAFAHALVDAGADLVFGHSSHVFRGIELYKGRPILYGAGNFVDDYAIDTVERNDQSFIYVMEPESRIPLTLPLYPTLIRRCHALRAEGVFALAITKKMQELCTAFNIPANWNPARGFLEIACTTAGRERQLQAAPQRL